MTSSFVIEGRGFRLDLSARTHVMGVLNVTPDSFSDGGQYLAIQHAVAHAQQMAAEGADIIDVGGESTRPGANEVPVDEELRRVIPVIRHLATTHDIPISIDTRKAEVARRALEVGAQIVNDVSGLTADPAMAAVVADAGVPVVVMHAKGTPKDMQHDPQYDDVIDEIRAWLASRVEAACQAGIRKDRLIIDPGIGFGKRLIDNLLILKFLSTFSSLGCPILVGPSRKSFIGKLLGVPEDERLEGTAAAVAIAIANGAHIVRVHDVRAMVRVAKMTDAIVRAEREQGGRMKEEG